MLRRLWNRLTARVHRYAWRLVKDEIDICVAIARADGFNAGVLCEQKRSAPPIVRDWLDIGLVPVTADQVNPYRIPDGKKRPDDFRTAARKAYIEAKDPKETGNDYILVSPRTKKAFDDLVKTSKKKRVRKSK